MEVLEQKSNMLKGIQSTGNKDTRSGFGDGIVEAARKNSNIVALTADLAGSSNKGPYDLADQ